MEQLEISKMSKERFVFTTTLEEVKTLKGHHADLIITDWPHYLWNRVIMYDRKQRLKAKYHGKNS